ncbi:MAG: hypothetical protein Q9221_001507 [Calogaya cf. arnoldii]
MTRTRQSASNVDNSTSAARPSRAAIASVPDTEQSVQENTLTLIPITHPSDPQKAATRGSYKIPSTLHDSLSKFLNPDLKWGFVMCCVGGQNEVRLRSRIASVEKYLDDYTVNSENEVDRHEEAKDDEGKIVEATKANRGAGVVEIHPRIKNEVTEEVHDTDDGLKSHITIREEVTIHPMKKSEKTGSIGDTRDRLDSHPTVKAETPDVGDNKRRKMPARDRATTLRDAIRALDESEDDLDPDKVNDNERNIKRQKRYDSDDSKMELQKEQSHLTDSSASSGDESLTDNEIPNSRGSRTPVDRESQPVTTLGQSGRKKDSSPRRRRRIDPVDHVKILEQKRRKAARAPKKPKDFKPMSETTKIAQWPESMMSIGPTDHLSRGITSERAIKMVQERERTKKEAYTLEYYAILFARLFSPDTIANLLRGCHRYSILVHDDSSNAAQQTSRFELLNMGEQIPELVKELVNAYIAADTAAVFARKLQGACNQITNQRGEFWRFIRQWTAGPAGRVTFTPMTAELTRFVIETVTGQTIRQFGTREWGKRRSHFTGIRRQGNSLHALVDICTPAVCLLVATMAGNVTQTLKISDCGATLEEFVGEIMELVPEYKTCFKELNERLWKPIMERHQLPHIRLLDTEVLNLGFTKQELQSELYKKSVRYWLEIDDKAKRED